jgi:hypothetical protein
MPTGLAQRRRQPYLSSMSLPRPSSPRVVIADLRAFFADRRPHQLIAAGLAVLIPTLIVIGFILEARSAATRPVQIIYVQSWPADRTDPQIIADQKKAQAEKDALARERQRQFQRLARQLGIDD